MGFVKKHLKFVIGVAVLLLAVTVFFVMMKSEDSLEGGTLNGWKGASETRRIAAVQILTGSEENNDIMVQCLDKMATLPGSVDVKIKDAASLCLTGLILKDNL